MTDVYRQYVESVWKAPIILAYGSTEMGGGAGMECHLRQGYHLDEYNLYFEILDPDKDGYGELVVTTAGSSWGVIPTAMASENRMASITGRRSSRLTTKIEPVTDLWRFLMQDYVVAALCTDSGAEFQRTAQRKFEAKERTVSFSDVSILLRLAQLRRPAGTVVVAVRPALPRRRTIRRSAACQGAGGMTRPLRRSDKAGSLLAATVHFPAKPLPGALRNMVRPHDQLHAARVASVESQRLLPHHIG